MSNRDLLTRSALTAILACATCALPALGAEREVRLLEVSGKGVKLDLGARGGVQVGQIYDLYRQAKVYFLPLTMGKVPLVKPQELVAQVQVYEVEQTTSLARILTKTDKKESLKAKSLIGVHNPTAAAPNREPTFKKKSESFSGAWGSTVRVALTVSNEDDDQTIYTWSVNGGRLRYQQTTLPINFWTPPIKAGEYSLQVTVRDSANNRANQEVSLRSEGVRGSAELKQFAKGRTYSGASRYGGPVADVGFEWRNTPFVLRRKQGWGGKARVVIDRPTFREKAKTFGQTIPARDFKAIAVLGQAFTSDGKEDFGALFGIDPDEKVVVRHNINGNWSLAIPPLVIGVPDGGNGNGRFANPVDLALSKDEDLYVLDAEQRCVQVFKVNRGKNSAASFLVSFGRPGKEKYDLQRPVALAIGAEDVVYVLDDGRKTVVVYRNWRPVAEIPVGEAEEVLSGLAVDPFKGEIYVLSKTKARVRRYSREGQLLNEFGGPIVGVPSALQDPTRIRISPTRELWVLDRGGASVVRFAPEKGSFRGRTGGLELSNSLRIAAGPDGGFAALDTSGFHVTRFDRMGWVTARFGREGTKNGEFEEPVDIAIGATNEVYVLDAEQQRVHHFMPRGRVKVGYGKGFEGAVDLTAVNDRSHIAVLQQREKGNFTLLNLSPKPARTTGRDYTGDLTPRFGCVTGVTGSLGGRSARRESELPWLWSIDEDREKLYVARQDKSPRALKYEFNDVSDLEAGPNGQVFVVDYGNEQLVLVSPSGAQLTPLKHKALDEPWDLGVDDFGHLFVFDGGHKRILELVPKR